MLVVRDKDVAIAVPRVALDRCTLLICFAIIHGVIECDNCLSIVAEDVVVDYTTLWRISKEGSPVGWDPRTCEDSKSVSVKS